MAGLYWFPFFAENWLSSPARSKMLAEQRGAYIDLLCYAWGNGEAEPSILAADAPELSGLGKRWVKLGALILAQFQERDGKLYNAKLSEVWNDQQRKHEKAVERGKTGGRSKAAKRKKNSSQTREDGVDESYQSELEEAVETSPKGLALPASAPGGALAPEAPRAPALARYSNPAPDEPDAEDVELRSAYRARLNDLVDQWCVKFPEDAAALEEAAKIELLPPMSRLNPTDAMKRVVRERVVFEVAKRNPKWPGEEQWCAQQRVAAMEESAA